MVGFLDKDVSEDKRGGEAGKRGLPNLPISSDSEPQSNHEWAMKLFKRAGYTVRYLVVSPAEQSVPQSRPRIHYMGICNDKLPGLDHEVCMDGMHSHWKKLYRSVSYGISLSDVLVLGDMLPTQPLEIPDPEPARKKQKSDKCYKWEAAHSAFKTLKRVTFQMFDLWTGLT